MIEDLARRLDFFGSAISGLISGAGNAAMSVARGVTTAVSDRLKVVFDWLGERVAWLQENVPGVKGVSDFLGGVASTIGGWKDALTGRTQPPGPGDDVLGGLIGSGAGFLVEGAKGLAGGIWDNLIFPVVNRFLQMTGAYALLGLVVIVLVLGYLGASGARSQRWVPAPMAAIKLWVALQTAMFGLAFVSVTGLLTMSLLLYPTEDAVNQPKLGVGSFRLLTAYGWQSDLSFEEGVRFTGASFIYDKPVTAVTSGTVTKVGFDDPTDPYKGLGLTVEIENRFLGPQEGSPVVFRYGGLSPYLWQGRIEVRSGQGSPSAARLALFEVKGGARTPEPTFTSPHVSGLPAQARADGRFTVMVPRSGRFALTISAPPGALMCAGADSEADVQVTADPQLPAVRAEIAFPWDEEVPVEDPQTKVRTTKVVHHPASCGSARVVPARTFAASERLYAAAPGASLAQALPRLIWPITGRVSQEFGSGVSCIISGSDNQCSGGHTGIDLAAPAGTVVVAAASGTVHRMECYEIDGVAYDPLGGCMVYITHPELGVQTRYAHLLDNTFIETGKPVRQGEPIGLVGASGLATGAHLHFEVMRSSDCVYVNPRLWAESANDPTIATGDGSVRIDPGPVTVSDGLYAWDSDSWCRGTPLPRRTVVYGPGAGGTKGPLFKVGDYVRQGQRVAHVGATGERLGAPYLALQIHFLDDPFDPRTLLPGDVAEQQSARLAGAPKRTTAADPMAFLPRCSREASVLASVCSADASAAFTPLLLPACVPSGTTSRSECSTGLFGSGWDGKTNFAFDPGGTAGGERWLIGVFGYPRPFTAAEVAAYNAFSGKRDWSPVAGRFDDAAGDRVRGYASFIRAAAERYDVPASLIAAVIHQESGGDAAVIRQDADQASGLMQVTNFWWNARPEISFAQRTDPGVNISVGTYILAYEREVAERQGLRGDEVWRAVVARYHGGYKAYDAATGRVGNYIDAAGARTPGYVTSVLALRERYRSLDGR